MNISFQRLVAISVVLILLCATAMAQNEKCTKSDKKVNHGVTLTTSSIKLKAGAEKILPITLLDGYKNPILIYIVDDINPNINTAVKGKFVSARIFKKENSYSLRIKATEEIKETISETIYIKATQRNSP